MIKNGIINQKIKKYTINNLKKFCNARQKVITLFDDYTTIASKAKYETNQGK